MDHPMTNPMNEAERVARDMTPDHIIGDIGRKLADDISAACHRNINLVWDQKAAFIVSTYGAVAALGVCSGSLAAMLGGKKSPSEMTDALWETLRPMVLNTFGGILSKEADDGE